MYGIQQTDKTSISIQAVRTYQISRLSLCSDTPWQLFGMNDDVGLVGQQFQWLTTM